MSAPGVCERNLKLLMKKNLLLRQSLVSLLLIAACGARGLAAPDAPRARFGRLSGTVTDVEGNPLMGATVVLMGPLWGAAPRLEAVAERILTDAHGEFAVARLAAGLYSIRVVSPMRLPLLRNGIQVVAGETARQKFVLGDIFSSLRLQAPSTKVSVSGDDWKWVLRNSASTRPVLRYKEASQNGANPSFASMWRSQAGRRLIGMMPGSSRSDALADDPGFGSVLAYLRPLSEDSDLLVAGLMAPSNLLTSSLATSFRKHVSNGDPQELTLVVHQLNFGEGAQVVFGGGRDGLIRAQGVAMSYFHSHNISDSLTLTTGFGIDYLDAPHDAVAARPRLKLDYRVDRNTSVVVQMGTARLDDGSGTLLERIGSLNSFPRVTLRGDRARLEESNHAEVGVHRRLSKTSKVEVAAFRDDFQNAAVWGLRSAAAPSWLVAYLLPNPTPGGVILNAGDYRSSGFRAAYSVGLGSNAGAALDYSTGEALTMDPSFAANGRFFLRPNLSRTFGGKVWARIPVSHTQITTSYQSLQPGRVTGVDPYGQAELQLQPFLGFQIRQPLPALSFFPAHIEALADFRNLLGQGYAALPGSQGTPFLLTSAYQSFRGGFSVQF